LLNGAQVFTDDFDLGPLTNIIFESNWARLTQVNFQAASLFCLHPAPYRRCHASKGFTLHRPSRRGKHIEHQEIEVGVAAAATGSDPLRPWLGRRRARAGFDFGDLCGRPGISQRGRELIALRFLQRPQKRRADPVVVRWQHAVPDMALRE